MTGTVTTEATLGPTGAGVDVGPGAQEAAEHILTAEAVELLETLHRRFEPRRRELLAARAVRQAEWDSGALPGYPTDDEHPEAGGSWKVAPLPRDLLQRRVEITGPINDTKMVINMLSRNADGDRADAAMLDFEDSMKPSWSNVMAGVENLIGAARGDLAFERAATETRPSKTYQVDPADMPLLMARCRGLHLDESNLEVDGSPIAAGLMDLALSAFHTAHLLIARGKTPKYYVPKCEHYLEARWWNDLLSALEDALSLKCSSLRATFLIETLPAAFQVEEILYELREHAAGLNVGRWDKIFSDIKVLMEHPDRVMADRATISMDRPWMLHYAKHLVRVCHRHGAFAMGGMAAFTPGKNPELRAAQTEKVLADKRMEAELGHDGCWVSHPYFIGPALSAFARDHQLDVIPDLENRPDLLPQGGGSRTLGGLRTNCRVGIAYMQGWQNDQGCVAWDHLMEDLATLEISRAQVWQWLRHAVQLDDGTVVTRSLVHKIFEEELDRIVADLEAQEEIDTALISDFARARQSASSLFTEDHFRPFLASCSERAGATTDHEETRP